MLNGEDIDNLLNFFGIRIHNFDKYKTIRNWEDIDLLKEEKKILNVCVFLFFFKLNNIIQFY